MRRRNMHQRRFAQRLPALNEHGAGEEEEGEDSLNLPQLDHPLGPGHGQFFWHHPQPHHPNILEQAGPLPPVHQFFHLPPGPMIVREEEVPPYIVGEISVNLNPESADIPNGPVQGLPPLVGPHIPQFEFDPGNPYNMSMQFHPNGPDPGAARLMPYQLPQNMHGQAPPQPWQYGPPPPPPNGLMDGAQLRQLYLDRPHSPLEPLPPLVREPHPGSHPPGLHHPGRPISPDYNRPPLFGPPHHGNPNWDQPPYPPFPPPPNMGMGGGLYGYVYVAPPAAAPQRRAATPLWQWRQDARRRIFGGHHPPPPPPFQHQGAGNDGMGFGGRHNGYNHHHHVGVRNEGAGAPGGERNANAPEENGHAEGHNGHGGNNHGNHDQANLDGGAASLPPPLVEQRAEEGVVNGRQRGDVREHAIDLRRTSPSERVRASLRQADLHAYTLGAMPNRLGLRGLPNGIEIEHRGEILRRVETPPRLHLRQAREHQPRRRDQFGTLNANGLADIMGGGGGGPPGDNDEDEYIIDEDPQDMRAPLYRCRYGPLTQAVRSHFNITFTQSISPGQVSTRSSHINLEPFFEEGLAHPRPCRCGGRNPGVIGQERRARRAQQEAMPPPALPPPPGPNDFNRAPGAEQSARRRAIQNQNLQPQPPHELADLRVLHRQMAPRIDIPQVLPPAENARDFENPLRILERQRVNRDGGRVVPPLVHLDEPNEENGGGRENQEDAQNRNN